jgi:L-2-hydroxyglutarate oxidase LhgO
MNKVQCVVGGGGVIGCAVARKLSKQWETFLLESCSKSGTQISSRNSEVLHAGIYYEKDSMKAKLCTSSVPKMYNFLSTRNIPYNNCGKLIVAVTAEDENQLDKIFKRAIDNGVHNIRYLTQNDVLYLEPTIKCFRALYSPSTGVFDSHAFLSALLSEAESRGCVPVYNCSILAVNVLSNSFARFQVKTNQGDIYCDNFINACGFGASEVARNIDRHDAQRVPDLYALKGNYFKLNG